MILLVGPCWACKRRFVFDPRTVTSLWVDPVTQLPPDLGGDRARARREPLCSGCLALVNAARAEKGAPPVPDGSVGSPNDAETSAPSVVYDPPRGAQ